MSDGTEEAAMSILVTGGTGHLGSAIVSGLRGEGHRVRALAQRPRAPAGPARARSRGPRP